MSALDHWLTTDDDLEAECADCGGDMRLAADDPEACGCGGEPDFEQIIADREADRAGWWG